MADNFFAQFDTDSDAGVTVLPPQTGENYFSQFDADQDVPPTPSATPAPSSPKPQSEALDAIPGVSFTTGDAGLDDAFARLDAHHKRQGTDALNAARGGGFIDGLMDPQEYAESVKGIIPGAIQFGATTLKGAAAVKASGEANAAALARVQLDIFDRIDRGEAVPEMQDPIGYQHMSPAQRQAFRPNYERAAAGIAPTPLAGQSIYKAGEAVSRYADTVLPAAPGYDDAIGRQLGEGIGSLVAGLPAGFLGRIPAAAFFGAGGAGEAAERAVTFDRKERAAGRAGLSDEQINVAGLWGVAPGATDLLPVETLLGRLKIPAPFSRLAARAIGRIGGQAFVEGMQEGGQAFLQNLIAKEIYNPEQTLIEGTGANAAMGAGIGGIAQSAKEIGQLVLKGLAGHRSRHAPFPGDKLAVELEAQSAAEAPSAPQPATEAPAAPEDTGQRGVDVIQFIRGKGGLKPSGELDAVDAKRYPGLVSSKGLSADEMRAAMVDAGYLEESGPDEPAKTTPQDVFDLVSRSIGGERIVPVADRAAADAFAATQAQRDEAREFQAAEQTFTLPEIARYDAEFGEPILRRAYDALDESERRHVIDRNRRGEDIGDLLEEMAIRNEDAPAIAAMVMKRGLAPEQIERVRAVVASDRPDLLGGFDEFVAQMPVRQPAGARAKVEQASALGGIEALDDNTLGAIASSIRNSPSYKTADAEQMRLPLLADEIRALTDAGITVQENGSVSRADAERLLTERDNRLSQGDEGKPAGEIAPMAVPVELPEEGTVALTDEAQERRAEMQAAVVESAAKILPASVRVDVVDNIEIARLRHEDQMLAASLHDSEDQTSNIPYPDRGPFADMSMDDIGLMMGEVPGWEDWLFKALSEFEVRRLRAMPEAAKRVRLDAAMAELADTGIHIELLPDDMRIAQWNGDGTWTPGGDISSKALDTVSAIAIDAKGNRFMSVAAFNKLYDGFWRQAFATRSQDRIVLGDQMLALPPRRGQTESADSGRIDAAKEGAADETSPENGPAAGRESGEAVAGQSAPGGTARPGEGSTASGDRDVNPGLRRGASDRIVRQESVRLGADGSIVVGRQSRKGQAAGKGGTRQSPQRPGSTEPFSIAGFDGRVTADALTQRDITEGNLASLVYEVLDKNDGSQAALLSMLQRADGAWEVDHVEVRQQRAGIGTKLYNSVEKDLGIRMSPSGILSDDGLAFWRKRSPASVQWHVPAPTWEGLNFSPRKVSREVDRIGRELVNLAERRGKAANLPEQERLASIAAYRKERGQLIKLWGGLPAEARAKAALDSMFALRGAPATAQILTPEFRRWFDNSKVLDENGRPLVVFHGTARGGFSEFDTYGSRYGLMGQGAYFTENPSVASEYTDKGIVKMRRAGQEAQMVYPVFLSIKNPIDMDGTADPEAWAKAYSDYVDADDIRRNADTNEQAYGYLEELLADEQIPSGEGAEIMQDGLRAMGHDGITHMGGGRVDPDGVRHRVWIAFDPEQIKSATGNRGSFDPTDPNINNAMRLGASDPQTLGQTDPYSQTISIAMHAVEAEAKAKGTSAAGEAVRVLRHEAVEFFKAMGMFRPKEWATLEAAARKQGWIETTGVRAAYTELYRDGMSGAELQDLLLKEAIAEQYSEFHLGRKQFDGAITRIFQRIKDFLTRIMNALRGMGFQTWEEVFERIDAGEFASRFEAAFGEGEAGVGAQPVAASTLPGLDPGRAPHPLSPQPAGPTPGLAVSGPGSLVDIQRELRRRLDLPVARGRLDQAEARAASRAGGRLMGQFSRQTEVIRLRVLEDIDTEAHEVGHALESRYRLGALQSGHSVELMGLAQLSGQSTLSEGFAEFFRLYLTNPPAAQAHAPTFLVAFERLMERRDAQTLRDIQAIRDQYQEWRNASSAGRLTAAIKSGVPRSTWADIRREHQQGGLTSVGGMFWRWLEQVYKSRIDRTNPIRVLVERIARQAEASNQDLDLSAWRNPQMQAQKIGSADGASYIDITRGIHWENAAGRGTVNLRDALATAFGGRAYEQWTDEQRDAFGAYLIARRGRWLWQRFDMDPARDRGRLANPPASAQNGDWYFDTMRRQRRVYLGGRWEAELTHAPDKHTRADHEQAIIDLDAANPQFAAAAAMVYQFSRDLALKRYQAGLDNQEEYEHKITTLDYVPWFRDMTDEIFAGTAVAGRKVPAKFRLRGSYRDFINPIEGIVRQVHNTNHEIAVNKPKLLLAQMAETVRGAGRFAEVIPATRMRVEEVRVRDALEAAARQQGVPPDDARDMISAVAALIGDDAVARLFRSEQAGDGRDAILHYMDGGELKMVQIHDDGHGIARDILGFFEAVRGTPAADGFFALITAAVRVPQKGITSTLAFLYRNLIRDAFQATVMQAGYFPVVSNIRTVASNRARAARGEESWGDILARHGGIMGGIGRTDIQQLRQGRVSELRTEGVTLRPWRRDFWARTINPWHEDFWKWAEWSEANARQTIARISFQRAIADARSRYPQMPAAQQTFIALEAAVQRSRDYTDYGKMGDAPSQIVLNRLIMFLNPAIQGPAKMIRALFLAETNEGRYATAQVVRKKLLPLFSDQHQRRPLTNAEVAALREALRMWVTIAMIAITHLAMELAFNDPEELDDKSELERALNVTFTVNGQPYRIPRGFDVINVVSNAVRATYDSWRKEDPTAWKRFRETLGLSLLPPASSPLLDLYIAWKHNRNNFFDSAIEPEYMKGKLPPERYSAYTSKLARDIAEAVDPLAPFDVSPLMVEYTMNALGSDWARDILRAYDVFDPDKPALRWQEYPFIRATRGLRGSRGSTDFWNLMGQEGTFLQPAGSYKSEAVDAKVWTRDEIRRFFDVRVRDDDAKAYAILNAHYDKAQRRLHPMERARDMSIAVGATMRAVASNRIDVPVTSKTDERAEVSREVRGQTMEILSEINRREFLNALITLQRPGYENREPQPVKPYLKELEAISPSIYTVLRGKLTDADGRLTVYEYDEVRKLWPEIRRRLLTTDKRQEIIEATGQIEFKDLKVNIGSARAMSLH